MGLLSPCAYAPGEDDGERPATVRDQIPIDPVQLSTEETHLMPILLGCLGPFCLAPSVRYLLDGLTDLMLPEGSVVLRKQADELEVVSKPVVPAS
jgi:hypothetical protein